MFSATLLPSKSYGELLTKTPLDSGLEHYKSGDYSKALVDWHTLLQDKNYSRSPELLYNLALTEFKMDDYGSALAHLRKAQVISPFSVKIYKTMVLFKKSIAEKEFYHVESESYAKIIFYGLPKTLFVGFFIFLILAGSVLVIKKRSEQIPFWSYLRPYVLFLVMSALPLCLIYLQNKVRSETFATLTGNMPAIVYTSHTSKAPELGTLRVGDVFQVVKPDTKANEGWLAVTTNDIPLGWIKANAYIVHRSPELISSREEPLNIDQKATTN